MRVAAVLELPFGEPQRGGQRAGGFERAVAVGADSAIDGLAPLERRPRLLAVVPVGDESGVIDVGFVGGRSLHREHRRIGRQGGRAIGATGGDLREVADEVEELPPIGEQVGEAVRHQRLPLLDPLLDRRLGDRRLAAAGGRVTKHEFVGRLPGHEAGAASAVVGDDRDAAVCGADHCRRIEQRLDEVGREPVPWHALRQRGEIRAERRGAAARDMALRAGEVPRMKDGRTPGRVAPPLDVGDEGRPILGRKRGGESVGR